MQSIEKIIYKMPIISKYVKKWKNCNKEISKLKDKNEELDRVIKEMDFEIRRNAIYREIDRIHFRKIQRDMIRLNKDEWNVENNYEIENDILYLKRPLVSIIVVNHNGKKYLSKLLQSLVEKVFYDNFEIIIVDNASDDDSLELVQKYKQELPIRVIQNTENFSFSKANNIGAKIALGEYVLFLNNDTEVTDGWLDELLISALTRDNVGAIGATLIYPEIPNDSYNRGKSYMIQHEGIAFREGSREDIKYWQPYNVNNGEKLQTGMNRQDYEWFCVTAAVLLVKKTQFELCGGFDEQYLYGYEDVDFCLKLKKNGFRNYCCGNCLIFHYEFGTQSEDELSEVRERRINNARIFQEKWQDYLQKRKDKIKLNDTL